ncbi:kinase-like domain-containing protein [Peziza echinospora]|nr:kinase-like domain-containing protein [Peziza echinospora]
MSTPANVDIAARIRETTIHEIQKTMAGVRPELPYVLDDLIGRGSFGSVFKAHKKINKEVVAIKVLNMDVTDENDIRDAISEVTLLSALKQNEVHNICRYHESFLEGARLWVVMDYCSGGSVRTLFKAGKLEEKYVQVIVREILVALCYIHKNGIIHRDVKAANILINKDGRVQLCDFGVSAQLNITQGKRSTFVGTPWWMAPEVIIEGATYNSKADIWSLGITIIELCNLKPPLNELEPMRAIMLIPRQAPPRLEGGNWTNGLRELVALCLNEHPDDRPSADELSRTKVMKGCKLPASCLKDLIVRYEQWKARGGVRHSVLAMGGDDNMAWDEAPEVGDWDFDTIKSRLSGVPSFHTVESGYISGGSTYKMARTPSPMRTKDTASNGAPHPLLQLFSTNGESYKESNTVKKVGKEEVQRSVPNTRTATPEGFVQIDMDIFNKDNTITSHSNDSGIITIPDFQDTYKAATAPRAVTPPAPAAPEVTPPPVVSVQVEKSSERPPHPPSPPRIYPRGPSPTNRPTVSAPSSPPRQQNIPQMQLTPNHANNGHKSHHLPSKSAPNMAGLREATGSGAPPVPTVSGGGDPKIRSADSTPPPLHPSHPHPHGPPPPHMKARSQDISIAPGRPSGTRASQNKPGNLNLKLPSTRLSNLDVGGQGMLPPSPSRPFASPHHTPHHSISSQTSQQNGYGNSGSGGASSSFYTGNAAAQPQTPSFFFPPLTASLVGESWDLPQLDHPNLDVLSHTASTDALLAELDRILGGVCSTLEVMGLGIESLAAQRRRDRMERSMGDS